MPIERRSTQSLNIANEESDIPTSRQNAAHLEYERLMAEAKQAFDSLTAQHAMARSASATRRNNAKTT